MWRGVHVKDHIVDVAIMCTRGRFFVSGLPTGKWWKNMHGCMVGWMDAAVHECADTKNLKKHLGYPFFTRWSSSDFLLIRGLLLGIQRWEKSYFVLQHSNSLKLISHQYFRSSSFRSSSVSTKLVSSKPSSLKTRSLPTSSLSTSIGATGSKTPLPRSSFLGRMSRKSRSPEAPRSRLTYPRMYVRRAWHGIM